MWSKISKRKKVDQTCFGMHMPSRDWGDSGPNVRPPCRILFIKLQFRVNVISTHMKRQESYHMTRTTLPKRKPREKTLVTCLHVKLKTGPLCCFMWIEFWESFEFFSLFEYWVVLWKQVSFKYCSMTPEAGLRGSHVYFLLEIKKKTLTLFPAIRYIYAFRSCCTLYARSRVARSDLLVALS